MTDLGTKPPPRGSDQPEETRGNPTCEWCGKSERRRFYYIPSILEADCARLVAAGLDPQGDSMRVCGYCVHRLGGKAT